MDSYKYEAETRNRHIACLGEFSVVPVSVCPVNFEIATS